MFDSQDISYLPFNFIRKMNFFKFAYDVFVWITNNYSQLPDSFKKSFPEDKCVNGRLFLSGIVQSDSTLNTDFADYE